MNPTQFIHTYFNLEKQGGMLICFNGLLAFFGAGYFLCGYSQSSFYIGMAWPLLIVAVVQIIAGAYIYWKSPKDIERVEGYFNNDAIRLKSDELVRIKKVINSFVRYVRMQVFICIVGVLMIIFTHDGSNLLMGIGVGLLVQGGIMLMFDYLAERRAGEYCRQLEQVVVNL